MNKYIKSILFVLGDLITTALFYLLVMEVLRYDTLACAQDALVYLIIGVGVSFLTNLLFGLYVGIWKYAGFWEAFRIACAALVVFVYNLIITIVKEPIGVEWAIITTFFTYIIVFLTRFMSRLKTFVKKNLYRRGYTRVMIIGAGSTGSALIREMRTTANSKMVPVCVIDDDLNKIKRFVNGIKVVGDTSEIARYVN